MTLKHLQRFLSILLVTLVIVIFSGLTPQTSQAQQTGERIHIVRPGETLQIIASYYGTTWHAIAVRNNLSNPNHIYSGQQLIIPVPGSITYQTTYVVQRGDTLREIAIRFGTTWQAIATANNLPNANRIYAGQVLVIPRGTGVTPPSHPPVYGNRYIVRPGDTLSQIARNYGVDMWNLARANNILNLNHIYVGQLLVIP